MRSSLGKPPDFRVVSSGALHFGGKSRVLPPSREPEPAKRRIAAQLDDELVLYCLDQLMPVNLVR